MKPEMSKSEAWPPTMVACVGAVVFAGVRALFVRQAHGHPLQGQWCLPWGIVEPPETPEMAIVREIQEEAGIVAEVTALLGIQNLPEAGWLGIAFLCRHLTGHPTPDNTETDRADYLSLADIDQLRETFEPWSVWLACRVLRGQHAAIPPEPANPFSPRLAFL